MTKFQSFQVERLALLFSIRKNLGLNPVTDTTTFSQVLVVSFCPTSRYQRIRKTDFPSLNEITEQSPSWEANRSSANQEIPRILRNQKILYRIFPILSHINPVNLLKPSSSRTFHQLQHSKIPHGARFALSVLYGYQNRQRLLLYTALTDWFL